MVNHTSFSIKPPILNPYLRILEPMKLLFFMFLSFGQKKPMDDGKKITNSNITSKTNIRF